MYHQPPVFFQPATTTTSKQDVSPTEPNVLSRLHALFNPNNSSYSGEGPSIDHELSRAKTEPIIPVSPLISPGTFVDRQSIKVLVVTWNMGDALPKGDLSVLLGDVPHYTPGSPTEHLPTLPKGNIHPYHIVVVAGQECPTHSGVPRGLAGGLMKGVHVRGAHRREKEERRKKEEEEATAGGSGTTTMDETGLKTPAMNADSDEEFEDESRGGTPLAPPSPNQPMLHRHMHNPTSKGWSTMLDDWFCGPSGRKEEPIFPSSRNDPSPEGGSPSSTNPPLAIPMPPNLLRSSSSPSVIVSPTQPLLIPPPKNATAALAHSPLARSASSSASSSSSADSNAQPSYLMPVQPPSPNLRPKAATVSGPKARPAIVIPNDEPERTRDGEKCYLHLVKERLMGMYLSIYVYKGCEHLVQGVDKDFVTAGLAGGRVGNKGGIGISLKLADHRFLFVNSHLAAHTARVGARLANIEKIKSELRLDCFLPKDDPRLSCEDITDRFDSVFWCGDLNFRLDLSRLHAEWLVEQKKYDEALMWDQLKAAMRDPQKNPFPGFQEGIIDFPPTFKYDVWRSVKATNRELRRSMRRRGTLDGKHARRPGAVDAPANAVPSQGLSHVPEAETHEELAGTEDCVKCEDPRQSDDDTRTVASRRSFESNGGGYTSAGPSTVGTDVDDTEDFSTSVDASAYGSRHKALEVAFKEKTKHFLSLVKMDKVLSPSPSRRKLGRSGSRKIKGNLPQDLDLNSRRASISSLASFEPPTPISESIPVGRGSTSSNRSMGETGLGFAPPRRPSDASWVSTSPNQPLMRRRFSVLKRTVSSRSSNNDGKSGDSHEQLEDIDETIDNREGVYDTSKKQRVPSWCDRVLWKSVVTPDEEPRPHSLPHDDGHEKGHRPFSRLSHAFSNLGGHLRLSITRTGSVDPHDRPNMHFSNSNPSHVHERPPPPTPPPEPNRHTMISDAQEYVSSPTGSPSLRSSDTLHDDVSVPTPRRSPPRATALPLRLASRPGSTAHPLLDANSVQASPPAYPKITFDPALPADADRSEVLNNRPRANSDGQHRGTTPRALSSSSDYAALVSPIRGNAHRRSSGSLLRAKSEMTLADLPTSTGLPTATNTNASAPTQSLAPRPALGQYGSTSATTTGRHHRLSAGNVHSEDKNAFVKFIKEIPGWLHAKSSPNHETVPLAPPPAELFKPRRHAKGEVVCLHYGTIDDAGMRQLEGRSDHRPAIFAAAVYVGD